MIPPNVKHSQRRKTRAFALSLTLLGSSAATMSFVSGCESQVNDFCVARCDCQGCSQREREDCLDDIDDSQRLAEHDGCATEFAEYLNCYANEGTCTIGAWIASTCTAKGSSLRSCSLRSASFVKTACEEEKEKRAACGVGGGGADPCTGADECTAFCALSATCSDFTNPQPNSTYVNCVINCTGTSSSSGGSSNGSSGVP